jgi:hypothetical protein
MRSPVGDGQADPQRDGQADPAGVARLVHELVEHLFAIAANAVWTSN